MAQILVLVEVHMANVILRIDNSTREEKHCAIEFFIVEGQEAILIYRLVRIHEQGQAMPRSTCDF
jgi:hypothetical protein